MQSEVDTQGKVSMTQSRQFPGKLEPPTHSCSDLLPQMVMASKLSEGLHAWDPVRATEQFLLPDFLADG